jgi:hypothetical protein
VSGASTATLTTAVKNYIAACSTHYTPMGGLKLIDVVNEPVNTALAANYKAALTAGYQAEAANANDKNNQYGWVIWAFQLARKNFPNATLLINEYNIEMNWNNCRAPYIAMVNAIKNAPNLTDGQKNLIDGVGLQCHGIGSLTAANFKACIDEIWTKTGVPVHITEFDQAADPNEGTQQSVYSALIPVAWEHPNVAGITLWGYVQGHTWINGNGQTGSGGTDSGIIYANGTERPAMTWLKSYMAGRPNVSGCGSTVNVAPTVSISSPTSNATFTAPASITINATAADADGSVSNVQFFNGTTLLGSDASSPYSFAWTNVAAGTYTITARATDNSGATTASAAITVVVNAPVNTPPAVSITSPAGNATFTSPASITINATATDADGSISNVQFFNGTTLLGSDASSPYSFAWTNVAAGTYIITAKATDNSGAVTTSSAISITVNTPVNNIAPVVSITAPANNAVFTGPASITIAADASDADGTISSVQFYNGATLLGTDATSPYSFSWSNVPGGTYTITAKATDNSGAVTTSSAVIITVTTIANQAPAVTITAPVNNATFTAPASVTITADASDADGTISSVQFFNGSTLLGTDATSPYSFAWTNIAAGTYAITAKATDNSGAVTISAAVGLIVTTPTPPAGDFTGPSCGAPNSTITFELNANRRALATNYSWWFQGYTQSVTPVSGTPYEVNISTGQYFTGGQVCVGVNYSVAPYYASYCTAISLCPPSLMAAAAAAIEPASVAPNPSQGAMTITATENITSFKLVNDQGLVAYTGGSLLQGESLTFGEQLPSGLYMMVIQYASGRVETLKVQRTL